jgi:WD40 repeat protein/serine/threonine protein kinase
LELARQVDQVCDRFEEAWLAGARPRIESFLNEVSATGRPVLAGELLRVELEHRYRAGDRPTLEEYQGRFPDQLDLVAVLLHRAAAAAGAASLPPCIPGYEILGVLGQGGMGIVYRARQVALNRLVALKMIRAGAYAAEHERARFRREAEAAAPLRHPNIVPVYEVGEHDGYPFLALEYVEGGSLADRLRGTPQPPREVAELVEILARAIHYAHEHGVVHRDLKPANVLLAPNPKLETRSTKSEIRNPKHEIRNPKASTLEENAKPEDGASSDFGLGASDFSAEEFRISDFSPKVTDFGLAKDLDSDLGQTSSGAIVGTPSYMAPEQASGVPGAVGPAADVYALGAVLYEALTGRPPFKGAGVLETLEQVRSHEPVPPRRLQPKVPRDLETICLKCLEKGPARRYPDAAALADDLHAFRDGKPIQARPVGSWERTVKWARRRPAVAALAAAVVAITALAWGLVSWREQATVTEQQAEAQRRRAERLDARLALGRGQSLCEQGEVGRGMLWLARTLEMVPEDDVPLRQALRMNLAAWRGRLNTLREVLPHPAAVRDAFYSPDGRAVLTVGANNRGFLWDPARGKRVGRPLEHPDRVLAAAWEPAGRHVLTGCADGKARLWEAARGRLVRTLAPHDGPVRALLFGPGGKTAATAAGNEVHLWETATGRHLAAARHRGLVLALALPPDGKFLVSGGADGTVRRWDPATLRPRGITALPRAGEVRAVYFSPHGKVVVTVGRDEQHKGGIAVRIWDAAAGRRITQLHHRHRVRAVAFRYDGAVLATAGVDHTVRLWDTGTGKAIGPPLSHQDAVWAVAFSPDGGTVLSGSDDRTARLWDAVTGRPVGQPLEHHGPVRCVAFAPDGRTLLTGGRDRTARLWTPAPARLYVQQYKHHAPVMALAWAPGGKQFVSGTDDGWVWRWQADTGERQAPLRHKDDVWVVAYSPNGKTILTGSRDRTVRLWDAATGKPGRTFTFAHRVRSAAFSPDGRRILTEGGPTDRPEARFWDVATGAPVGPPLRVDGVIWQVAYRPDGKACAIASGENTVQLWDLTSRTARVLRSRHQNRVVALAFSPDGLRLATGSTDQTARVWDARTGAPAGEPLPHRGAVWGVAFSQDSRTLLTGGRGGGARLWDVATGMPVGPAWPHQGVIWAVACQPAGRTALTGGADRAVRRWELPLPLPDKPARITAWVQAVTGLELDDNGTALLLSASRREQRRRQAGSFLTRSRG